MFYISLRNLLSFRKSNFNFSVIQMLWRHEMDNDEMRNILLNNLGSNTVRKWNLASLCNITEEKNLSDCNWMRARNHLVHKRTLNHLAKLATSGWTKWLSVRVQLQSLKFQISRLLRARSSWHSGNYRVWIHSETRKVTDKNIQSEKFLSKNYMKNVTWKTMSRPFLIFKEYSAKRNLRSSARWFVKF